MFQICDVKRWYRPIGWVMVEDTGSHPYSYRVRSWLEQFPQQDSWQSNSHRAHHSFSFPSSTLPQVNRLLWYMGVGLHPAPQCNQRPHLVGRPPFFPSLLPACLPSSRVACSHAASISNTVNTCLHHFTYLEHFPNNQIQTTLIHIFITLWYAMNAKWSNW